MAAFARDGFVILRNGVPPEFSALLAAAEREAAAGGGGGLEQLARRAPPRALACKLMDSARSLLLALAPDADTSVQGMTRFSMPSGSGPSQVRPRGARFLVRQL